MRDMFLKLRSLQGDHEHIEKRYEPGLFEGIGADAFRIVSPVTLAFDIDRQEKGRYHVAGHLSAELEATCSRCLEPFTIPVDQTFDLRYQPHTENTGEGELEIEEDDLTTAFYENDEIDLGQLMREQFYLALPMKPLCSDDCKGLCPQCGTNLNTGTCSCDQQWTDPRLSVLKNLVREH